MLFEAIKNNDNNKVIELIRYYNIDVNKIEDDIYLSPLHYAVEYGNKDIVVSVLEHGGDVNLHVGDIQSPIHVAINKGNIDMVKLLIENGADVDICCECEHHGTPLQNSIINNNYDITELLLTSGADTHDCYTSYYPLMTAIRLENIAIVKLLIRYKVNVDKMEHGDGYPINLAVRYGNIDIVKELLKYGANPNTSYEHCSCLRIPLHQAIYYNKVEIVKLLIAYGANVNSIDYNGNTPMHLAVNERQIDIVKILLDAWADITVVNELTVTCFAGCYSSTCPKKIIEMLISRTVLYKYTNAAISIKGLLFNWLTIESDDYCNNYKIKCEKEILKMLNVKIDNKCLLDVCLGKVNYKCLIRYIINNEDFCINEYSIYRELLEKNILAAKERDILIQNSLSGMESCLENNRWHTLPVELKHMILCYLSNDDLRIIVDNIYQ
ncbi:SWPV1-272 [Shearwaterpox virus]|uniref:SWPV1-272 n=1 Tax=Shearwaterpox virus TaxID=1974596 RepID=A0A1V0S878_CNPV|nr:SWPV1-272 [Shearwaterpox virus]